MIKRLLKYFGYISLGEHQRKVDYMANAYNMGNCGSHIRMKRRGGNTSRTVDLAIQELFFRRTVTFHDHHPTHENQNRVLNITLHRLQVEHGIRRENLTYSVNSRGIHISFNS